MARCDYANARSAARRGRLLGERGLRDLLARPGTEERLAALAQGPWRGAVAKAGGDVVRQTAESIGSAIVAEVRRVLSFLDGKPRRLVQALLRLDDALVLEAVMRGLLRREPRQRIVASAWPSPGVPVEVIAELAALAGPERAPEVLGRGRSPLAGAVAFGLGAAGEEPRLLRFGVALQRATVDGVSAEVRGRGEDAALARTSLAWHVDAVNATTLLVLEKLARPDELFVPGGHHDAGEFATMTSLSMPKRRARIAAWLARVDRAPARDPELLQDAAWAAEHLARAREKVLWREARARPLSIAVPLALMAALAAEARRLRLVLLGAQHGLPPELLLDLVEA